MDAERDASQADSSTEALLTALYAAIEREDIDAVVALFHPDARIPDSLEARAVVGRDEIRAYYLRQFATIRVDSSLISTRLLPNGRIEAALDVQVHGAEGGSWGNGRVTATYGVQAGLITEMVVNTSLVG